MMLQDYDADFFSISARMKLAAVEVNAGYDLLGSDDGNQAFRAPLAAVHKWQGWADKFLNTPANGIEDTYIGVSGSLGAVKLVATLHDYEADEGGADYGDEINLSANWSPIKAVNLQLKYADYDADEIAGDTTKLCFTVSVSI